MVWCTNWCTCVDSCDKRAVMTHHYVKTDEKTTDQYYPASSYTVLFCNHEIWWMFRPFPFGSTPNRQSSGLNTTSECLSLNLAILLGVQYIVLIILSWIRWVCISLDTMTISPISSPMSLSQHLLGPSNLGGCSSLSGDCQRCVKIQYKAAVASISKMPFLWLNIFSVVQRTYVCLCQIRQSSPIKCYFKYFKGCIIP